MQNIPTLLLVLVGGTQAFASSRLGIMMPLMPWLWALAVAAATLFVLNETGWSRRLIIIFSILLVGLFSVLAYSQFIYSPISIKLERGDIPQEAIYDKRKWIRVFVDNNGYNDMICHAVIIDIIGSPTYDNLYYPLYAGHGGDQGPGAAQAWLIPPGDKRPFNVVYAKPDLDEMFVANDDWPGLVHDRGKLGPGRYEVKMEVSGKDCPTTSKEFIVSYQGRDQISAVDR